VTFARRGERPISRFLDLQQDGRDGIADLG
jgi:hypothetical protein